VERFNALTHKLRKNYKVFGYDVVVDWEIGEFWRIFECYQPMMLQPTVSWRNSWCWGILYLMGGDSLLACSL